MRAFRGDNGYLNKPTILGNGFLRADAFFTRVGVFEYRNRDGTVRRELRLPDEVFNPDSMSTFQMSPVTFGHPPRPVTSRNAKRFAVGHSGQDVRRDGDKMRGSIMVTDDEAIAAMKKGTRQISNGYFCELEMTAGVTQNIDGVEDGLTYDCIQRNIEGNHIAIVDRGRAGDDVEARVDALRFDGVDAALDVALSEMRFDGDDAEWRFDNPFEVREREGKFEVVKSADGKIMGTHETRDEANEQLAALEAAEDDRSDDVAKTMHERLVERIAKDSMPMHMLGVVAWPRIMEMGLTLTEVAQALGVQENGVEPILSGDVVPTGRQIERLAVLIEVPANDLKDLLPERQRELTDGETLMDEFDITINGVTYKVKGDSAARQAITKKLADDEAAIAKLDAQVGAEKQAHDEALAKETARADSAEEAKDKAEAERDAANDPSAVRKRIDERLDLERTCTDVLGDDFDAAKTDGELREAVILKVQPDAKLDGKGEAYIDARFDAAVEIHKSNKSDDDKDLPHARTRRHAHNADADTGKDPVEAARERTRKRNADAWKQPLAASKDRAPDPVSIKH